MTSKNSALANPTVNFRDSQWEAIYQLASQLGRVLCVQCTGWGKSMGYFVSAKLVREQEGCRADADHLSLVGFDVQPD